MTGSVVQPTFLSTFDRESRYPIFITFCECLSIAEIIPLTQTCKSLSRLYQYLLPIQWDVDKALRRYVGDPCGLRSQMAKYDALIAGSFAVQYFERASWEDDRTLDLIVRQGPGSDLLSKHISEVEGYSKVRAIEYGSGEEVILCAVLPLWILPADLFAIADAGVHEKCRQQHRDFFDCYTVSPCPIHFQGILHYCGSRHH